MLKKGIKLREKLGEIFDFFLQNSVVGMAVAGEGWGQANFSTGGKKPCTGQWIKTFT